MKKLIVLITLITAVLVFGEQTRAQTLSGDTNFNSDLTELEFDVNDSSNLLAYNYSNAIEILVEASSAVNDLCNYFNGSWLDAGLTLYCAVGGDIYTCTTYKVVKAACGINGVLYLTLQGDFPGAAKSALKTTATLWGISKISSNKYKLYEVAKNYCPR